LKNVGLRPIETASQLGLAPLITALDSLTKPLIATGGATHKVDQQILRIPLGKIHNCRRSIQTSGVGVDIVDNLVIRFVLPQRRNQQPTKSKEFKLHNNMSNKIREVINQ
jgi:hypothetical protein